MRRDDPTVPLDSSPARRSSARVPSARRVTALLAATVVLLIVSMCTLVFGFVSSKLILLTGPEQIHLRSVYIQSDFPLYDLYTTYFTKTKGYLITRAADADIVIAQQIPSTYGQSQIIYNEVCVLTEDFKDLNSAITSGQYAQLLASHDQIAVARSLLPYYPALQPTGDPLSYVRQDSTHYAIIPFENLTNRFRTVDINGNSPIRKSFDEQAYPLKVQFLLASKTALDSDVSAFISQHRYANYTRSELHTIIMTGTTALGRGEYFHIFQYGTAYPAMYVAPIMRNADITHVSDEVSYVPGCVQQVGTDTFCALPDFIQTLQDAGVNLVELTGNHNNDFGPQYCTSSIQLYNQDHIKHFGGGLNLQDARNPAIFKLGDTTFAFLGYNQPGPSYAFATSTQCGAAPLDVDQMKEDIQKAKRIADVVFVDVQWTNEDNEFPDQSQVDISQMAIDDGADVVTGSSGHRPEGMSFYNGKTIFYGLGNLFFDQMENLDTRQNVILHHSFYGKRLVSSELIPTLLYDYCQPRPVTGPDAQAIYDQVFQASPGVN
jgi:hypothetical protein